MFNVSRNIAFFFCLLTCCGVYAQYKNSTLIDSLLNSNKEAFGTILQSSGKYKIQIIYTQIDRDEDNKPHFTDHYYMYDSSNYFYCASLVKLPCSVLALEKVNALQEKGISRETIMLTDSVSACEKKVHIDTTSINGLPSVEQYIKRMLLVSDNLAYGRIYEFLTPDYIHGRLSAYGFPNMRIVHRFDGGCKGLQNVTCNPICFVDSTGTLLYKQEQSVSIKQYDNPLGKVLVGKAYIGKGGKKINEPKDFTTYNYMSLKDIHKVLQNVVFWDDGMSVFKGISRNDWQFLMKYLSMYPRESQHPSYNTTDYYDSYKKYFMYGDSKRPITDTNVRIYNIVGQSYGFMVDCAYIVDFKTKTEFMLSAVIYANEQNVINTGKYEYRSLALPYLSSLGKTFYNYETKRKRTYEPDFSVLKEINRQK